jgi:hypothetical protein
MQMEGTAEVDRRTTRKECGHLQRGAQCFVYLRGGLSSFPGTAFVTCERLPTYLVLIFCYIRHTNPYTEKGLAVDTALSRESNNEVTAATYGGARTSYFLVVYVSGIIRRSMYPLCGYGRGRGDPASLPVIAIVGPQRAAAHARNMRFVDIRKDERTPKV